MTKLTKDFMRDIIAGKGFGVAPAAVEEMARTVLAGVEQEPAAWILTGIDGRKYIESDKTVVEMFSCFVGNKVEPLYATPQPVPATRKPVAYMNRFTSRVYTLDEQPGADTDTAVYAPVYLEQPAPAVETLPLVMKDHQIRELVNELRNIAIKYHGTYQLRERISRSVRSAMQQQPVSNRDELNGIMPDYEGVAMTQRECYQAGLEAGKARGLPDGWVMVPVEPTEDMIIAGFESEPDESFSKPEEWEKYEAMSGCQQAAHRARLCWSAMVAAAPQNKP